MRTGGKGFRLPRPSGPGYGMDERSERREWFRRIQDHVTLLKDLVLIALGLLAIEYVRRNPP